MNSASDFDLFILSLRKKIDLNPEKKAAIIRQEIEKTPCPYLQKKQREVTLANDYTKR